MFDLPVVAHIASMTVTVQPPPLASPCIKRCALDPTSGLCIGCGRTLTEIAGWIGYTDHERTRIMAELPPRLASLTAPKSAKPA
jgi:predicted Fe-S protein YdhL (DUF1289 family)